MATTVTDYSLLPKRKKYADLASSMTGLPENYNFSDLAKYESGMQGQFGDVAQEAYGQYGQDVTGINQALQEQIKQNQAQGLSFFDPAKAELGTNIADLQEGLKGTTAAQQEQVGQYVGDYGTRSADRRAALAQSLADIGQQTFSMATPGILEDLQRRGLATSTSEVNNAQSRALKEIALRNQEQLLNYDTTSAAEEERLREMGLQAGLSGQEALAGTQQQLFSGKDALSQALLNRRLADIEGLSGLQKEAAGQQADILGSGVSTALQAQQDALDTGLSLRQSGLEAARADSQAAAERASAEDIAKKNRKNQLITAALGVPTGLLQGVGTGLGFALCFDGETPVTMMDGTTKPIKDIEIGDLTKGGGVVSVRKGIALAGTRYNYQGVIVTGSHAVFEGDVWKRVENSDKAVPIENGGYIYSLITKDHRIYVGDIMFADEFEYDEYPGKQALDDSLAKLNAEVA